MTSKRYLGNIITDTPTEPAGPYENSLASGVWSIAEAETYTRAGLWPTAGNALVRAVFAGGNPTSGYATMWYNDITTLGNSVSFGDMQYSVHSPAAAGSDTIGIFCGGWSSGYTAQQTIQQITFASTGNATSWGSLSQSRGGPAGLSNSTRAVFGGGATDQTTEVDTMDYITFSSSGNAVDFGNITQNRVRMAAAASSTRGLFAGGGDNNLNNRLEIYYITIATTGDTTSFGNLTAGRQSPAGCSSSTRAVFGGGAAYSTMSNVIDYVTIASTGNATDFGDLTVARAALGGACSNTRALFAAGPYDYYGGTGGNGNTIDYITIATTGNAADFGDINTVSLPGGGVAGNSNVHGGLQ